MKNENLIFEAMALIENQQALDKLRRFLLTNTPDAGVGKLNLYNYVAKNPLRPVLGGVFYDKGFAVATDAHILVALKTDYGEEKEGKVYAKDGTVVDGCFPNYRAVIPAPEQTPLTWTIDTVKVVDVGKRAKVHKKETGLPTYVSIKGTYFEANHFQKLITFAVYIGATTVNLPEDTSRPCTVRNNEDVALLTPVSKPREEDLIIPLD